MIRLGNFLFRYRNGLFLVAYLLLFAGGPRVVHSDVVAAALGLAVALTGQAIRALAIGLEYIIRGGRNRQVYAEKLVTEGLFAHCRNPLYVGNFLILAGLGIAANNWWFLGLGMPAFFVAYWAIIAAEEHFLRQKFGAEFVAYCARVHRFIPRLHGLGDTLAATRFNWQRLVVKEYGSTFAWTAGWVLVVARNLWAHQGFAATSHTLACAGALLALLVAAYLVARHLKKSGRLKAA